MAQKLDLKKTKETFDKLLSQAKDSVKVLEALREEGFARARTLIPQIPTKNEAQKLANDKLVAGLKKLGFATRKEVLDLEEKVDRLQSELKKAKASKKSASAGKSGDEA